MDHTFHGILTKVAQEMNASATIFDIPNLYNPLIPLTHAYDPITYNPEAYPVYTLCDIEPYTTLLVHDWDFIRQGTLDDCSNLWKTYICDSYANKNPYLLEKSDSLSICGHGVGNAAR